MWLINEQQRGGQFGAKLDFASRVLVLLSPLGLLGEGNHIT
jgi:hypothetical protein